MNQSLILMAILFSIQTTAQAAFIRFSNPEGIFLEKYVSQDEFKKSVGTLTVEALQQEAIMGKTCFDGSEKGITEIGDYGALKAALSPKKTVVYGWCYTVNGKMPDTAADQVFLTSNDDEVRWFYGYMVNKNGHWSRRCKPIK